MFACSLTYDARHPPARGALKGDRAWQHAISVNDQWRICFLFTEGDAYDVEFCDYHQLERSMSIPNTKALGVSRQSVNELLRERPAGSSARLRTFIPCKSHNDACC